MVKVLSLLLAVILTASCGTPAAVENGNADASDTQNPETEAAVEVEEKKELRTIKESFGKVYFLGDTDKNPLEYAVGEEIRFTVTLYGDGEVISAPLFKYEISRDGGYSISGTVDGTSGSAEIIGSCDRPGYIRLKVYPCDENGNEISAGNISIFEGGALADFDKIEQTYAEPKDFDEFWEEQLALVYKVSPELIESVKLPNAPSGFELYDIKVKCVSSSRPVSGYVTVPINAEKGSCKLFLTYMAYGVASSNVVSKDGYISICVNPHGIENGKPQQYYAELSAGELKNFGFKGNDPAESSYFRDMLLRDVQAVRYLTSAYSELWNGKDIEINGGSLGAFRATAVAALMNDVVTKLTINIPGMSNLGSEKDGRIIGWGPPYSKGLLYYDTVNFAKRVKAPVTITAGLGDSICLPSGTAVLYKAFKSEKTLTFIQNKTHSYNPEKVISYTK